MVAYFTWESERVGSGDPKISELAVVLLLTIAVPISFLEAEIVSDSVWEFLVTSFAGFLRTIWIWFDIVQKLLELTGSPLLAGDMDRNNLGLLLDMLLSKLGSIFSLCSLGLFEL